MKASQVPPEYLGIDSIYLDIKILDRPISLGNDNFSLKRSDCDFEEFNQIWDL